MPALNAYQRLTRPRTRSVACVITYRREMLLVRHTYRDQERWTLPGALRPREERADEAARREMEEELGRRLEDWHLLRSRRRRSRSGLSVTNYLHPELDSREVTPDGGELSRTAWLPLDDLPAAMSQDAVSVLSAGLPRP